MEIVKRVQGGDARRGEKSFQSKDEDERNERDADAREETDVTAIASIASIASIDRELVETAEDSFRHDARRATPKTPSRSERRRPASERDRLARELDVEPSSVRIWFMNRRRRDRVAA